MFLIILLFSLSMLFCFFYLSKLISIIFYVIKKEKKYVFEAKQVKRKEKQLLVLKKKSILARKKLKNCFQSKPFFAKFLYLKDNQKIPFVVKCFINKIYKRLKTNACLLNEKINFKLISNSGVDLNKPVFLMFVKHNCLTENLKRAVEETQNYVCFQPIFISEEKIETQDKNILFNDVNLKLFQELNKVDLNYNSEFKTIKNFPKTDVEFFGKTERIYNFKTNNISYFFNSNKNKKIKVFIKIKSLYFNLFKTKNCFKIIYFNEEKIEYFSNQNISKVETLNIDGKPYLCVHLLAVNDQEAYFGTNNANISKKHCLLEEKFEFNKLFNIKIFTNNKDFNVFFNKELPNKILQELRKKNYIENEEIKLKKSLLINVFSIEEKDVFFNNYFDIYNNLLKNIFGIKLVDNRLFISPKIQTNFKVNLFYNDAPKNIFVSAKGKKELVVNNVVYSNISFVDLDLIDKTAFLCV